MFHGGFDEKLLCDRQDACIDFNDWGNGCSSCRECSEEEQLRYGTPQNANEIAYWPGGSSWVQLLDPKCDLALAAEEMGAEEINLFFCERISA
jgi:hypothetical protein